MSDPKIEIDWIDEALAGSILIFTVVLAVTYGPGFALWVFNQ